MVHDRARPPTGLAASTTAQLVAFAQVAWWESAAARAGIHRTTRSICDTRLLADGVDVPAGRMPGTAVSVGGGAARIVLTGECACRDLVSFLLVEADAFLVAHDGSLYNPPGAVRAHLRKRLPDWGRARRTEMGAQARTDRLRDSVRGRALPDPFDRALLEYLAAEAGSAFPLHDDAQLHRRLGEMAAAEFGGVGADYADRVTARLPVVEAVCRSGRRVPERLGSTETTTWWERYIEWPMGRRRRYAAPAGPDHDPALIPCPVAELAFADIAGADERVLCALRVAVFAVPDAPGRARAVRAAVAALARDGVLPAWTAEALLADPRRVQTVLDLLLHDVDGCRGDRSRRPAG